MYDLALYNMIQLFEVLLGRRHYMVHHDLTLYNFAKVGVEGSNPFARSSFPQQLHQPSSTKGNSRLPAFLVGVTLG